MLQGCCVCKHPQSEEINKAIIAGVPLRDIEGQFQGVNKSSLGRHKQHLPSKLFEAAEEEARAHALNLFEEIERLREEAMRIAQKAESQGDLRTALAGVRELTRIVELLAKLRGEIKEQSINILINPQWIFLRATILEALEPFPEARVRLAEVLSDAD